MTKEQKQYAILGAIIGVILVISLVMFVVNPLRTKWRDARGEYNEINSKLDDANRLMRNEPSLRDKLEKARNHSDFVLTECIPDPENSLSWVTQRIYQYARKAGVDIQSVSAGSSKSLSGKKGQEKARTFETFAVNVMVQCSYGDLLGFVREIEEQNPYVCVSGLIIGTQPGSVETHNVSVELQWPVWADLETATRVRERFGGDHG
jgi:hypothetical protein